MVTRAPVFARNHASVGPAMPAPLIRTRILELKTVVSVKRTLGI